MVQRVRERHLALIVVMAVGLAVGSDVHELLPTAVRTESTHEAVGETLTIRQQPFERDCPRNGAVVEEQVDAAAGGKIAHVGTRWVDLAAFDVLEFDSSDAPLCLGLRGRKNGEFDSVRGQDLESFDVYGGFGQPHALGIPIKATLKVAQPPDHLRLLVAAIRQRHDHVVVDLSDGGTVSGETLLAGNVGIEDGLVGFGGKVGHPREQGGAHVEANARVVVHDPSDAVVSGQNARRGVRRVTLRINALVPIVIGVRGILLFNDFKPGILARRLIKMTVNTKITVHMIFGADYEGMMNSEGVVYCAVVLRATRLCMQLCGHDRKAVKGNGLVRVMPSSLCSLALASRRRGK